MSTVVRLLKERGMNCHDAVKNDGCELFCGEWLVLTVLWRRGYSS